jgi:nitrogen regulatory protein PII-like uncharacterized protein
VNEDLQGKLIEYKDLNNHLEYSWQHKYEQLSKDREIVVETLKNGSEKALVILKTEYEIKINDLKKQCKEDITRIDMLR